jgi:hypothetical protein
MKKNLFKVLFIALLAFVFCTACKNEVVKDDNGVSIADFDVKDVCDIVKIGNHEYLYYRSGYAGSICHYADCEYCNKRGNKAL